MVGGWSVRAGRGSRRRWNVFVIAQCMLSNRVHDPTPLCVAINSIHLLECFIDIWDGSNQRSLGRNRAQQCFPVERVAPTVFIVSWTTGLLENIKKVRGPPVMSIVLRHSSKECESHGI